MLNGLDLFSGIGGITLALKEWVRPIAYCEIDKYAQAQLLSRMQEELLPRAPIWPDITSLRGKDLPQKVDIIYGGFPCQDISVAGIGKGLEGERSGLFFEIVRLAEEIKPTFIFLENVPAIRTRGASRVNKELAQIGYDCRWDIVSAQEVGAPHKRERWFLLAAHTNSLNSRHKWQGKMQVDGQMDKWQAKSRDNGKKESLAHSTSIGSIERSFPRQSQGSSVESFADDWWAIEPNVGRVVNGLSGRVDRIKALGNAVVPIQAKTAFGRLMGLSL